MRSGRPGAGAFLGRYRFWVCVSIQIGNEFLKGVVIRRDPIRLPEVKNLLAPVHLHLWASFDEAVLFHAVEGEPDIGGINLRLPFRRRLREWQSRIIGV